MLKQWASKELLLGPDLHNFIIVILDYTTEEPPTQVLQRSAGFCKMPVTWQYKDTSVCYITIDNHVRFPPSHYP